MATSCHSIYVTKLETLLLSNGFCLPKLLWVLKYCGSTAKDMPQSIVITTSRGLALNLGKIGGLLRSEELVIRPGFEK